MRSFFTNEIMEDKVLYDYFTNEESFAFFQYKGSLDLIHEIEARHKNALLDIAALFA